MPPVEWATIVVASNAVVTGSVSQIPDAHRAAFPDGICHAVPLGQPTALCGVVAEQLTAFP